MRLAGAVALATFTLDQLSKLLVVEWLDLARRLEIEVAPPFLMLRMAWNRGINFGLLAGEEQALRWGLVALAVAISAWVWLWLRRGREPLAARVAGGLLIGGALGNAVDRIRYGAVADFLNMSCCGIDNPYAFNIADVAIFVGALGLVLFAGRGRERGREKTP